MLHPERPLGLAECLPPKPPELSVRHFYPPDMELNADILGIGRATHSKPRIPPYEVRRFVVIPQLCAPVRNAYGNLEQPERLPCLRGRLGRLPLPIRWRRQPRRRRRPLRAQARRSPNLRRKEWIVSFFVGPAVHRLTRVGSCSWLNLRNPSGHHATQLRDLSATQL
jgi:hypothetical protein